MVYTVAEIAKQLNAEFIGNGDTIIEGLSPIDEIYPQHLIFAEGESNLNKAFSSNAAAVMVANIPTEYNKPLIIFSNPMMAFLQLLELFYPPIESKRIIHPTAHIGENVQIGDNVCIGAYSVIEDNCIIEKNTIIHPHVVIRQSCKIGQDCEIHPHVTLYPKTILGHHVAIHAGTVIGSDGFGYKQIEGIHHKIPHVGQVIIEDHVEIGANTVVDKATLGATRIGKGTKIDNLVQIAHSVKLGAYNLICAFTGISGSCTTGNYVTFGGNVGVSDHVKIDDNVILGARAGVPPKKHLKKGLGYLGNPARPFEKALEMEFSTTRIPFMRKHIQTLQNKVSNLEQQLEKLTSKAE